MTLPSPNTLAFLSSDAGRLARSPVATVHLTPTRRMMGRRVQTFLETQGPAQTMSEPFLVTKSRVEKVKGLERKGTLFDGTELTFGVHGAVKAYYKLEGQPDLPLPVDYLVTAAGG